MKNEIENSKPTQADTQIEQFDMKTFAERLHEVMKRDGITQQQLAEKLGSKRQTISQYVNGTIQPNIGKLFDIAKIFKVSADWLIGLSDTQSPDTNVQAIHNETGLSEETIEKLMYEMQILYNMTNKKTSQEALNAFQQYIAFINSKERSDDELYDYAEKQGLSCKYIITNKPKFIDRSDEFNLFSLKSFKPCCITINAIMHDETPYDEPSFSVIEALYDVVTLKSTPNLYVIAELIDVFDEKQNDFVDDLRISPEMTGNDFLYSHDIFSLKLINLQEALSRRRKHIWDRERKKMDNEEE